MKAIIIIALTAATLGACHPGSVALPPGQGAQADSPPEAKAYRATPLLLQVAFEPAGRLRLTGLAAAGAKVRLASPAGQPLYGLADSQGRWRLEVSRPTEPRLFGLAMVDQGRVVQSEGYVLITPAGTAAQLRAGAGTLALGAHVVAPVIDAVDFDAKGGTVVSGRATPHAALDLFVDTVRQSRGHADGDGRFSLALDEPQTFAVHVLEVVDGARRAVVQPRLTVASPLVGSPYRATATSVGWRIDWITPGGGQQTTLLMASREGAV